MPAVDLTDEEIGELLTLLNGVPEGELTDNLASAKTKLGGAVNPQQGAPPEA